VGLAPSPLARPLGLLALGPLRSEWVVTRARPLASRPLVVTIPINGADLARAARCQVLMRVIAAPVRGRRQGKFFRWRNLLHTGCQPNRCTIIPVRRLILDAQ
jgi:hypothetical protein